MNSAVTRPAAPWAALVATPYIAARSVNIPFNNFGFPRMPIRSLVQQVRIPAQEVPADSRRRAVSIVTWPEHGAKSRLPLIVYRVVLGKPVRPVQHLQCKRFYVLRI